MRTFEEIQIIVQDRLKKARVTVQKHKERLEREKHKPVTPVPPVPTTNTKTNGKAR
jgi:hypothetical protein